MTTSGEVTAPSGPTSVAPIGIDELQPLHTYHFRIVAENSFGRTNGPDETFTTFTAPVIVSQSTSKVTGSSADLNAVINPHGVEAEYHFEYGPTTSYGTTIPIPNATIPASGSDETVTQHLEGLNGGVYHFRITTKNIYGESVSKDQTFNFYPPVCPNATVRQQTGANELAGLPGLRAGLAGRRGHHPAVPGKCALQPRRNAAVQARLCRRLWLAQTGSAKRSTTLATPTSRPGPTPAGKRSTSAFPPPERFLSGGPPWDYGGYPPGWVQGYTGDHWTMNEVASPDFSQLVSWDDGHIGPGETYDSAEYEGHSMAPYIWNTTTRQADRSFPDQRRSDTGR